MALVEIKERYQVSEYNSHVYSLHVTGVWGRNRKSKRDCIDLGDANALPDHERVQAKAKAVLHGLKPKPGLAWQIISYPARIDAVEGDMPYTYRCVGITQGKSIALGVV